MQPAPGLETRLALVCRDVSKRFGAVEVVRGLNLSIEAGTIVALLGSSGCGKTTTLRLIAGLERIDAGCIEVDGRLMVEASSRGVERHLPPESRRIGLVFQDYALFPHLSVARNVGFGLPRGDSVQRRIDEMLDLVGLPGLGGRMPGELSGGQRQRVALARALAPKPGLVLLDEPFSNLDPDLRASVRRDVSDILREAGATAVLVTHDQEEALSLADQVALMMGGGIVQIDEPETLYQRPVSREVASFLGASCFLPGVASGSTVATEIGPIQVLSEQHGNVDVLVRPEHVRLAGAGHDGRVGEVVSREYFGARQSLELRLPSGSLVKAEVGSETTVKVGELVSVSMSVPTVAFPATAAS